MKHWFITGTSSGFGRIMTEQLLARGDRVTATARRIEALAALRERHPGQLDVVRLELTDTPAVHREVAAAFERAGRVDVVVANAGYGLFGAAEELASEQIRHQIETNLIGSIELIRAAIPPLRTQGGGRIVQVSSEGGQVAYANFSAYHATKWGIEGFIESVAQEVASFGIEFTIAEPGPASTGFRDGKVEAPALPVYAETPSGAIRRALADGSFKLTGDPVKFAAAMIEAAERTPAPRRLALGSGSYERIGAALRGRLAQLEAERAVTLAADLDSQPAA